MMICLTVFYIYDTDRSMDRAMLIVRWGHEFPWSLLFLKAMI